MPTFTYRSRIDAPVEEVFAWHERPGAFARLTPPWAPVRVERMEGIHDGEKAVFHVSIGPASVKWVAEHSEFVQDRQFKDVQVKGPFERWEHLHRFEPDGPDACTVIDEIEYKIPLGKYVGSFGEHQVEERLERMFAYRHRVLQTDVPAHLRYAKGRKLHVAISGASGLIGRNFSAFLTSGGHQVVSLVRSEPAHPAKEIFWNPREKSIDAGRLEGLDAVVHLAGENIFALRWTEEKKTRILGSRVQGTQVLSRALSRLENPPAVFLSGSAVGYYGDRGETVLTEEAGPGDNSFLSAVVQQWEGATRVAEEAGIRTLHSRTGVVLTPEGGMLDLALPAFKMGLGARIGARDQFMSWIALDDLLHAFYHMLWTESLAGPVNVSAPHPVTMQRFTKRLAGVLDRPAFFSAPSALLKLVSGDAADELFLSSQRAEPKKLLESGFEFLYPYLQDALKHELGE